MLPLNPYTVGNPIKEQGGFFGRQDVFKKVMDVLRQPSSNGIVLYGQRRIGKTTVLLQLHRQFAMDARFTPIYFDLQDKASLSLGEVLFQLAQHIAAATDLLVPNPEEFDQEGDYFRQTFLPHAAENAKGDGLVLLFDEFDVLDSTASGRAGLDFFPYLRVWMADVKGVQFVFVIGRRPEDLSTDTLAAFKTVQAARVSLLEKQDTESVIRQSERENTLSWTDEAVERIWDWTHGHPYLVQLMCSVIWDNSYEDSPNDPPQAGQKDVDGAIKESLQRGAHAFRWIWDGLPPAERVVTAAMAEASEVVIPQDEMVEILRSSGVRLIVRELELAPETLVEWEVLEQVDGGYRFMVPLLRRWVEKNRPLSRVKDELDRLDPIAEYHYKLGQSYYQRGQYHQQQDQLEKAKSQLGEAEIQLRKALRINPNHLKSRLLLGRILLEGGRIVEAVEVYEAAYQYDPRSTSAKLIQALLALTEDQDEDDQLLTYERILEIDPSQAIALEGTRIIWIQRAEQALQADRLKEALQYYQKAGDEEGIEHVQQLQIKQELAEYAQAAAQFEKEENWSGAIEIYETLLESMPEEQEWQDRLEYAEGQAWLKQRYNEALGALETGDNQLAQRLLADVINRQPNYQDAPRYLLMATMGVDVLGLQKKLASEKKGRQAAEKRFNENKAKVDALEVKLKEVEAASKARQEELSALRELIEPEEELSEGEFEADDDIPSELPTEDVPHEVDTEWVWWIGAILAVGAFIVACYYFVRYFDGGAIEAGLAVLTVFLVISLIGMLDEFEIGCWVGIAGVVIGLIYGGVVYWITRELWFGSWLAIAAGAIAGVLAFGLVLGATYGVERITNSFLNRRYWRTLNRSKDRFIEAIGGRGFEKSPRSDALYYNVEMPEVRFRIENNRIRFQKRSKNKKKWKTWESYNIFNEIDLALKVIGHPDQYFKSD
jgi:tetratricopeptide (TPR) repeat protein